MFATTLIFSQELDYSNYHNYINKAEKTYFLDKDVDSSLIYYDRAFKEFDFIFLKDLLNAVQIACFNNRPFETYILRSFDFGMKIEYFQNYPIIESAVKDLFSKKGIKDTIRMKRKRYLERLDLNYRSWVYDMAIDDQLSKSEAGYMKKINLLLGKLASRIKRSGFPGEKIIGIDDDSIYYDLGRPELDFSNIIKAISPNKLSYFKLNGSILATKLPILLLIHHNCSFSKLKSIFLEEMKKGNIHPRDIGLIHDNVFRFKGRNRMNYCTSSYPNNGFLLNLFTEYPKRITGNINKVNKLREEYFIVSVEIDEAKKIYEKNLGFNLFSGFWGCR